MDAGPNPFGLPSAAQLLERLSYMEPLHPYRRLGVSEIETFMVHVTETLVGLPADLGALVSGSVSGADEYMAAYYGGSLPPNRTGLRCDEVRLESYYHTPGDRDVVRRLRAGQPPLRRSEVLHIEDIVLDDNARDFLNERRWTQRTVGMALRWVAPSLPR